MTVKELIDRLMIWPADYELEFEGKLEFYRLKKRGQQLVHLEWNEPVSKQTQPPASPATKEK